MPFCPNGHEVEPNVAFCRQCGASLTPLDAPTLVETPVVAPPPAPRSHAAPLQSNTAVYVLSGVLVVIGLVGIGLALVLGSNNDSGRPTPTSQATPTPGTTSSSPNASSSQPSAAALPTGGTRCPGTVGGGGTYGTIGSATSCGFVEAVYQSFVDTGGLNEAQGQTVTVSATSPATHRRYTNIACTVGSSWVTCVGGNGDTARMFFAHP